MGERREKREGRREGKGRGNGGDKEERYGHQRESSGDPCSPLTQLSTISLYSSVCISAFPKNTSPPSPANSCVDRTRYPFRGRKGLSRSSDSIVCYVVERREEAREGEWMEGEEREERREKGEGARGERDERVRGVFKSHTLNKVPVKWCLYTLIEDFSEWPACSLIDMGTLGLKP